MDLFAVGLGEAHEREHVGLGLVHEHGELGELRSQLIGDGAPLRVAGLVGFLGEDGVDHREHHLPLTLAGMRQGVAQEVHAAALPGALSTLAAAALRPS